MTEPFGVVSLARRVARLRPSVAAPFAFLFVIGSPLTLSAQLVRLEEAKSIQTCPELGCTPTTNLLSLGYDPANQLFLVLSTGGPQPDPTVSARFVYAYGTVASEAGSWGPQVGGFRLAYSADVSNGADGFGGFLVGDATGRLRIVAHPTGLLTDVSLGSVGSVDVAYSPVSREFLVVSWSIYPGSPLRAWRVGLDGQPIGPSVDLGSLAPSYYARVVWNPVSHEFGIAYVQLGPQQLVLGFARVSVTGAVISTRSVAGDTTAPVLAVNEATGHYVMAWGDAPLFSQGIMGAEIDATGSVIASGVISDKFSLDSNHPVDLAYNPISGTFLLTGSVGPDFRAAAIELNGRGAPHSTLAYVTPGALQIATSPLVTSRTEVGAWLLAGPSTALYEPPVSQMVGTSTRGGGSAWPLGVPCRSPDPYETLGGGQCVNGEWLPIETLPLSPSPPMPGGCASPDPDLDGDGHADLLWRNTATGDVSVWLMNGTAIDQADVVWTGVSLEWQIVATRDLDGDCRSDLLWRHSTTGDVSVWLMNGTAIKQAAIWWPGVPLAWQVVAVRDLDGDGKPDLLWRNTVTGDVSVWLLDGTAINQKVVSWAAVPLEWQIADVGDHDGESHADVIWRNTQTGDVSVWLMNGTAITQA
ncbi:MAG TPA: VCBS repeat-containing protein, partial [Steroidobacteraceae bacterium]